MHYLFLGDDGKPKNAKIAALRQKILSSPDAQKFDGDTLYAHKLSAEELKKSLIALPAIASQRLVIIRSGDKLKKQLKDLLLAFFESDQQHTVVVLEAAWSARNAFVKKIAKFCHLEEFEIEEGENIFAVTRMMSSRRQADALTVLHKILDGGQHPLQIMGGLVWFWGNKARVKVSRERFEKGLLFLQEADLNIKRSKLAPDYALEVLITKLCVLLKQ